MRDRLVTSLYLILITCALALPVIAYELPPPPYGIRVYDTGLAPDFNLPDIDGEITTLSSLRGHWVMLHFWASWCGPCRKEMPEIQKMSMKLDNDTLHILMVNTAEDEDTVFSFLAEIGIEAHSLLDREGQVTETWKPRGLPTSFFIDPEGRVRYQAIGGRAWSSPDYLNFLRQLSELHKSP